MTAAAAECGTEARTRARERASNKNINLGKGHNRHLDHDPVSLVHLQYVQPEPVTHNNTLKINIQNKIQMCTEVLR